LLAGRWTVPILWRLFWGGRRFHQLRRSIGAISRDVLAASLEEMERRGVVGRRFACLSNTEAEYQLTELGRSLRPVLGAMHEWGLYVMSLPGEQQRALEDAASLERGGTGTADAEGPLRAHSAAVGASV
jgi:DNA-binding HxlR family transcriptional regulator